MRYDRYYVRWEECWGGSRVWIVFERGTRKQVSKPFKTEAPARRHCDRMNADRERYDWAMLDKRYPREVDTHAD